MKLKERLYKIICKQTGATFAGFSIEDYFNEGWLSEDDLIRAIKTLIRRGRRK